MKHISILALLAGLTIQNSRAENKSYVSPNKNFEIISELLPIVPVFNEAFETATLKQQGTVCWTYGCIARGFSFSWAPDSSGFLFEITHITRSMYLYYVHIDSDGDVYPISIDLESIKKKIAASLPEKYGNSAPKSNADLSDTQWTSSKKCKISFSQHNLGINTDSVLELNFDDPFHPQIKVISVQPK
jgi:hypothetical protein